MDPGNLTYLMNLIIHEHSCKILYIMTARKHLKEILTTKNIVEINKKEKEKCGFTLE